MPMVADSVTGLAWPGRALPGLAKPCMAGRKSVFPHENDPKGMTVCETETLIVLLLHLAAGPFFPPDTNT